MPKQVIVQSSIEAVEIIETPIPTPREYEIVIEVIISGTNPKDWKYPVWYGFCFQVRSCTSQHAYVQSRKNWPHNSGDDIAGIVHACGKDVYEFRPGDRVAAYHITGAENGSFAEYAVAPDYTTFHIPHNVSFEEAATVPVAALTAAIALYADMKLPTPFHVGKSGEQGNNKVPILIYGVTSAVGAFAAQLARLSGLAPIIGIAGRAGDFARTLVDHVVDYRNGEDALVAGVETVLAKDDLDSKIIHVFDAISENGSLEATLRFIDPNRGVVSTVLPTNLFARDKENFRYPSGVKATNSAVPLIHETRKDFGYIWSRYLGRLLADGRLKGHPYEVVPGGLNGVLTGLKKLRDGKASGLKYVYRIKDTRDNLVVAGADQSDRQGDPSKTQSREAQHPYSSFPFPSASAK